MAKEKKDTAAKKYYQLGEGATNFVDISTGKKISGKQIVGFELKERKSDRFRLAEKNGHIEEVDEPEDEEVEEVEEEIEDEFAEEKAKFAALKVEDRKKFLEDEYEFDEEELKALNLMKGPDLIKKYAELLEADSE